MAGDELTPEEAAALADDITGRAFIEGDGFFVDDVARASARVAAQGDGEEGEQ